MVNRRDLLGRASSSGFAGSEIDNLDIISLRLARPRASAEFWVEVEDTGSSRPRLPRDDDIVVAYLQETSLDQGTKQRNLCACKKLQVKGFETRRGYVSEIG